MTIAELLENELQTRPWLDFDTISRARELVENGRITVEELRSGIRSIDQKYYRSFDSMGNKRDYFHLGEKIFPVGRECTILIKRKFLFQDISGNHEVQIEPVMNYAYVPDQKYESVSFHCCADHNELSFCHTFEEEQMYRITIWKIDQQTQRHLFLEYYVYALEEDLYGLAILKGDFHCHTTYSDGVNPPDLTIAAARKSGLDFIAVTDHNNYQGSVAAEHAAKKLGGHITVIRGEEFSSAFTPMHILSLGAPKAVDPDVYLRRPNADERPCADGHISGNPEAYHATQRLLQAIADHGGISFLCHPLWKPRPHGGIRYDTPAVMFRDLVMDRKFCGVEIVSGSRKEEMNVSNLQHNLMHSFGLDFEKIPVIAVTDSHSYYTDPIAGRHFTIVFCKENSADAIIDALRHARSVAVELIGDTDQGHYYGPGRLCLIADFLIKEYFPDRDPIAYEQGNSMLKMLSLP